MLDPQYDDFASACVDGLGFSERSSQAMCETLLSQLGIGFSAWQATVPVDQVVCFPYQQLTPWGFVKPDFDAAFNASLWFSIIGYVFGGAAWFTLTCSSCCMMDQARLKGVTCYFWIATFFTGMSLIMFRSVACKKGFFAPYFFPPGQPASNSTVATQEQFDGVVQDVGCELSFGSKMAISATVLYFACSLMLPFSIVPFYEQRYYQSEYNDNQQQSGGQYRDRNQAQAPAPPRGNGPVVQGHVTGNV